MREEFNNYMGGPVGRNQIHPCIKIKIQDSVSYPILSLMKLTFLFSSSINILQKSIVELLVFFSLLLREVDTEFMNVAIQKQGPSRGGRI